MTLICILTTPSCNRVYGPICILAALVDIPQVAELDVLPTTVVVILPLIADGVGTGGGPFFK